MNSVINPTSVPSICQVKKLKFRIANTLTIQLFSQPTVYFNIFSDIKYHCQFVSLFHILLNLYDCVLCASTLAITETFFHKQRFMDWH